MAYLVVHLSSESESAVAVMDPADLVARLGPRVRAAADLRDPDVAHVTFWDSPDYYGTMETDWMTDEQDVQFYDRGWLLLDELPEVEQPVRTSYSWMHVSPRGDVSWEMLPEHAEEPVESRTIPAAGFGA